MRQRISVETAPSVACVSHDLLMRNGAQCETVAGSKGLAGHNRQSYAALLHCFLDLWGNRVESNSRSSILARQQQAPAFSGGSLSRVRSGFRPDIEGLRAIAVLPVVFNHVGLRGFWGGYVGVDIFFVISGYLITGILLREAATSTFSVAAFYRRRVARIFPALFCMLFVTSILCVAVMLPGELIRYAKSLAATTLFSSNMLFYAEAGYFEPAARLKPLLHTWSLAIEEQFYIFWPLLIILLSRTTGRYFRWTFIGVTTVSLVASVAMVNADKSAAFYLLPSRAWELGLGALLNLYPACPANRIARELMAVCGLAAVTWAIHYYGETTAFPGLAALLPCIGAAFLIATGAASTYCSRLLACAPLRFVGKISYSVYIWHWPIIVLAEIGMFLPKTLSTILGEAVLSLIVGYVSWLLIEQPARRLFVDMSNAAVLKIGGAAIVTSICVSAAMAVDGGLSFRFTPQEIKLAAYEDMNGDKDYRADTCFAVGSFKIDEPNCLAKKLSNLPSVALIGDSHAAHYWPGLSRYQRQFNVLQATMTGCKPVIYPAGLGKCETFFRHMLTDWTIANRPDLVVLAARWREEDLPMLRETLTFMTTHHQKVLLVGPVPQYNTALPRLLVFADLRKRADLADQSHDMDVFAVDDQIARIARSSGVPYLSMVHRWCDGIHCRVWAAPNVPMQFDYGHLTVGGSIVAAKDVSSAISSILSAARTPG